MATNSNLNDNDLLAARYVRKDLLLISLILIFFAAVLTGIKIYDQKSGFIAKYSEKIVLKFIKL